MSQNTENSDNKPKISIKYLFNCTSDIPGTRKFYSELIGLKETQYEEEWGYVCYQCEGFELMFFARENEDPPIPTEWASQPGYPGGKLEITSWAVAIPEDEYAAVVKKLKNAGVRLFKDLPEWRQNSYWGFTTMDPNGVTVEVYSIPKEKPALIEWIDI